MLVAVAALFTAFAGTARAQAPNWHGHDNRSARPDDNSRAYQEGYRDGMRAREHRGPEHGRGDHWRNNSDRSAYQAGYEAGYRAGAMRGPYGNGGPYVPGVYGRYPNGGYGYPNGPYPNGGPRYGSPAYAGSTASQFGYQDGYNDGLRDRQTGHSFRPTQDDSYKSGDHGYSSTLGSKDAYKQMYRQAYMSGYQRGYYVR